MDPAEIDRGAITRVRPLDLRVVVVRPVLRLELPGDAAALRVGAVRLQRLLRRVGVAVWQAPVCVLRLRERRPRGSDGV